MVAKRLEPRLELLREEYVLVQAWKKTASCSRHHNWLSDTPALDRTAVNLPAFISEIRERLRSSESWRSDSLGIVPAPKNQLWRVREGVWTPVEGFRSSSSPATTAARSWSAATCQGPTPTSRRSGNPPPQA